MNAQQQKDLLKKHNLRVTEGRLTVLNYLVEQKIPIGIKNLENNIPTIDRVTLYRMMEQFEAKGIVRMCDLGHGHQDYELNLDHHHHLVCRNCGDIEDVEVCDLEEIEKTLLKKSKKFTSIDQHRLTFMGLCKQCEKKD